MSGRPLRVLVAPDSFKGTIPATVVAAALARGWRRIRPGDTLLLSPLADGGEGTLDAIEPAGGWTRETARVRDPLGRPVDAAWLRSLDGTRAVVELAEAIGLGRVAEEERDPVGASSAGLGDLLRAVLATGATELVVGIGGSATTDAGRGMLEALGLRVAPGDALVSLAGLDPALGAVELRIASDVTNPLLGPEGAAAVYAPQKGASPEQVALLEARNAAFAELVERAVGRRLRELPGAGAAGGVGFGLLALGGSVASCAIVPGVELVMAATGFDERLATADLVLTGEGRIDAQTGAGKAVLGVARTAAAAAVPCVAIGGSVEPEGAALLAELGARSVPLHEGAVTIEAARAAGDLPVERIGARLAEDATLLAMIQRRAGR